MMVNKAVEEIPLQAHWHRDILKIQDTPQIILGSHLLVFSSPISPLLIQAQGNLIHHSTGPIAIRHC